MRRAPKLGYWPLEERLTPAFDPFTIVALPDTQYYAQQPALNSIFHAQTQWIVDNQSEQNYVFVTGLGDITNNGDQPAQWVVADAAYDRLDGDLVANPDGLIPYAVPPGNHDYMDIGVRASGADLYIQNFGSQRFQGRSWYGGHYLDKNHYQYFTGGGRTFLHIGLEYEAPDDVLDWAREVIRQNPGLPTILSMHSYVYDISESRRITRQSSDGNSGESLFRKLVYPNPQIFMVLNGHFDSSNSATPSATPGEFHQVSTNILGQPVFEMLSDYQFQQNRMTGNLRLIRFIPAFNRIEVKTYSPSQNVYQTGPGSQFSFDVNFNERFAVASPDAVRVSAFQEGVNLGFGTYTGTLDTQVQQHNPNTNYGNTGGDLLVDFPNANNTSQALLRFNNIFGTGQGQVPLGARILSATLTLDSNNAGAGAAMHRMVADWTEASTWLDFAGNGVQTNGVEARTTFASQAGVAALTPVVPARDQVTLNVTEDVAAWAAGETNRGWALLPWNNGTDGWGFSSSEFATQTLRPKLRIEWMPAATDPATKTTVFQQGIGGYTGAFDTYLAQMAPTTDYATATRVFVDRADAANEATTLLRFNDLFGNGTNQIRTDAQIEAAYLYLTTPYDDTNAPGGGASLNRSLYFWNATDAWGTSFGADGVQLNNVEALAIPDWNTGSVGFGVVRLDVTAAVKAWQTGQPNNGWAFTANSTDGWFLATSESEAIADRPRLEVISNNRPPRVSAVRVNDLADQRSRVGNVAVEFSTTVANAGGPLTPADFELKRVDGVPANFQLSLQTFANRTVALLDQFSGPGVEFGSLLDGRWTLRVKGTIVNEYGQFLDGNADGTGGDDYLLVGNPATNRFHRLFGDVNGDGTVDGTDFSAFGTAFGLTGPANPFDFNADFSVDGTDFAQFGARFGVTL